MQTIGERLEEARKKKGISIREAAEATKIRGDYLQKFESNHFDIGLTEIYTRGFLRTYANFLKLPADRIINDYAALGRGDVRPRQPSREVYGRMDISVATAGESSERAAPPGEGAAAEPASARPAGRSRSATSLPTGPDPAVIFRYVKWGGIAIVAIVLVLVISSLFTSGPADTPQRPSTPVPVAAQSTITLVASGDVEVRVSHRNADDSEGPEIYRGLLRRGQRQPVAWPGPIYIWYSAGENLQVVVKGQQVPTNQRGEYRSKLPDPSSIP